MISLDILMDYLRTDKYSNTLIYIPNALALVSIIASLRELVWSLRGASDGGCFVSNLWYLLGCLVDLRGCS